MFEWRKMPEDAKRLTQRFASAVPDIFLNSKNAINYETLVQEVKGILMTEIKKVHPEYRVISKDEIAENKDVIGVRIYAGRDEDFYTVYGHEVYRKKNSILGGSYRWNFYSEVSKRWESLPKAQDGGVPELDIVYCGCCGDVNRMRVAEYEEELYIVAI